MFLQVLKATWTLCGPCCVTFTKPQYCLRGTYIHITPGEEAKQMRGSELFPLSVNKSPYSQSYRTLTNEVNYTVRKKSRFLLGLKTQPIVDPAPAQQLTDLYLARKTTLWWGCKEKNECYDRKHAFRRATDTDVLETERDSLKRDFSCSTQRKPVLFVLFSQPAHASKIPPLP